MKISKEIPNIYYSLKDNFGVDWERGLVIAYGDTIYTNAEGKRYTISLQNTCMKCHSNKTKFCDECHNYAAVSPYCWDCHIAPKEKKS